MTIADHWKGRQYEHSLRPLIECEVDLRVSRDEATLSRSLALVPAYPPPYGAEPERIDEPRSPEALGWSEARRQSVERIAKTWPVEAAGVAMLAAVAAHVDEADVDGAPIHRKALLVGPSRRLRAAAAIDWGLLREVPGVPEGLTLRVRRWGEGVDPRALRAGLPLRARVDPRLAGAEDRLFDPLVRMSRDQGMIAWDFEGPSGGPAAIVHVDDAGSSGVAIDDATPLVVFRVPRTDRAFAEWQAAIDALLEQGAHAVLLVAADDPLAWGFFADFYRALMHNHPIDEAAARALADRTDRVDAWLSLRRGGELSLLLTHTLARYDAAGPRRVLLDPFRSGSSRGGKVAAWLQGRVKDVVDLSTIRKDERLTRLGRTAFDQEMHTLAEVTAAGALVREVHALRAIEAVVHDEDGASAATLRAATAWVERGEERLAADAVVAIGEPHVLAVAIETHVRDEARISVPFREEGVAEALRAAGEVELEVVVFADAEALVFTTGSAPLRLPIVGDSTTARLEFFARRPGVGRLRVALYFRGQVLQSFALELACGEAMDEGPRPTGVDWALTTDFAALDDLPAGGRTILVNESAGTHWFMARDRVGGPLLRTYDDTALRDALAPLTERLQAAILQWNGERFQPAAPAWDGRAGELVALARLGWSAYYTLFEDLFAEDTPDVGTDGRLTIARCHFARYNPPWAVLYRLPLEDGEDVALCPTFRARVEASVWTTEKIGDVELPAPVGGYHLPLVDDEQACRAAPGCPLADPARARRTVCPYGFMGVRGELEQPLQDVTPGGEELRDPGFTLPTVLAPASSSVRVGYDEALSPALSPGHAASVAGLFGDAGDVTDQRDVVLRWIRHGGAPVLYVFCHAEQQPTGFALRFGDDRFISPSSVGLVRRSPPFTDDTARPWPGGSLVVLNGCDTAAPVTSSLGQFATLLRRLGAVAIVGTETSVATPIASEFGLRLLALVRAGLPLGEALLRLRRAFLWQLNPIGLTYTLYASSAVHLHAGGKPCKLCPVAAG